DPGGRAGVSLPGDRARPADIRARLARRTAPALGRGNLAVPGDRLLRGATRRAEGLLRAAARRRGPSGVHWQLHRAGSGAVFVRLGRRHANAVHRLLSNHLLDVTYTVAWRDIHRAFELGRVERHRLILTPRERELLRKEAERYFGWDLIRPLPSEDRIQAAAQAIDEKLAPQRPDDGFVLAKGALPAPLPALPSSCALRVALDQLDVA